MLILNSCFKSDFVTFIDQAKKDASVMTHPFCLT